MASRNDRRTRTTRGSSSRMSSRSAGPSSRKTRENAESSRPTHAHAAHGQSANTQSTYGQAARAQAPYGQTERQGARANRGDAPTRRPTARKAGRAAENPGSTGRIPSARPSERLTDSRPIGGRTMQVMPGGRYQSAQGRTGMAGAPNGPSAAGMADSPNAARYSDRANVFAIPGSPNVPNATGIPNTPNGPGADPQLVSTSVRELRQAAREERMRKSSRRYLMRIVIIVGIVVVLLAGWAALFNSPAFTIDHVQVNGVEHLTNDEVSQLVNIPEGTTLLRVDTDTIANRLKQTAWIEDVEVNRVFPGTLEINVTERPVEAIVEIPTSSGSTVKKWAIAEDHMWLMPIPDEDSEAAKTTSRRIYEDAASVLHIVDVPYGTKAEIGQICSDGNVNNALDIVSGMTTELADRVVKVSAAGTAETTLILDNGVEIAFGKAEDIRDKERVILKILEENPDGVAYINVRMVETPTWRAV